VVVLKCINQRFFVPRLSLREIDAVVENADVVHLLGHWTALNALVFKACQRHGKPHVFCPAGALRPYGRSLALKRAYQLLVGRNIVRSAAACVAITDDERTDFVNRGISPERIEVIPNGIDPEQFELPEGPDAEQRMRERFGIQSSPFVLFLGRLNEIKGPDLLLDAFVRIADKYPELHLVFAGPDGGMLGTLRATCEKRSLVQRVHFVGYLDVAEKAVALRAAVLLAIPSRQEAMSLVVLEAGIVGTPVLFTTSCGLNEISRIGAGTMVGVSEAAIADGLCSSLSNQASSRAAAKRLNKLIRENYLWQIQARRYIALFDRLCSVR
jgi:glycosyltransferase involved in cell wall biosynthesis